MPEYSVLIGGKAGDGINQAGLLLARLFNSLGYRSYLYVDYPSLIRGGHNFAVVRAAETQVSVLRDKLDFILALNQDTVNFHAGRLKDPAHIIYDSDTVTVAGIGHALKQILSDLQAGEVMRNSAIIGSFARSVGISWEAVEAVVKKYIPKEAELNLKLARRGYDESREVMKIEPLQQKTLPVISGNEVMGMGLIQAGLDAYIAYPMTPSAGLLHFLAGVGDDFGVQVLHPESEIAVMLMALGFAYAGHKAAVGTSGGGFCLMTEGLSFAGMAELPVVILLGQRPGPSTGLPTYSCQTELHFALSAGQGEFVRLLVAPGDAEQAFYWAQVALDMAWKYQVPAIILSDKILCESGYSFDIDSVPKLSQAEPARWNGDGAYKRYALTENGVSPLTFVPDKNAVIKVNSYEHDEAGITTEDPQLTIRMQDKRLRKGDYMRADLAAYAPVQVYGHKDSAAAILCWGSNKGVCVELAQMQGLRVIQPVVLSPFPVEQFRQALQGVEKLVAVESNATGQLVNLIKAHGFSVNGTILKYDGRPFSLDELQRRWQTC